uniref:hypothetical protein n=1 Tax=Halomonas sp. TaxID=1486246 RepID=UPI00262AB86F|nr:hypothetical protein [Halomonas sp.]
MNKHIKTLSSIMLAGVMALSLSACGTSTGGRALSGAGIGAAVGAGTAAVTGGSMTKGAVIGGGLGAAAGAITDSDDIDLSRDKHRRYRY